MTASNVQHTFTFAALSTSLRPHEPSDAAPQRRRNVESDALCHHTAHAYLCRGGAQYQAECNTSVIELSGEARASLTRSRTAMSWLSTYSIPAVIVSATAFEFA